MMATGFKNMGALGTGLNLESSFVYYVTYRSHFSPLLERVAGLKPAISTMGRWRFIN